MRWALSLSRKGPIRVFFFGDGVTSALAGFTPANVDYNSQEMLVAIAASGGEIAACGTCLESRGMTQALIPQVKRGSMDELSEWAAEADKVINF